MPKTVDDYTWMKTWLEKITKLGEKNKAWREKQSLARNSSKTTRLTNTVPPAVDP